MGYHKGSVGYFKLLLEGGVGWLMISAGLWEQL